MDGIKQILDHLLQPHQVDELIISCWGQKVELWGRWLGWRDLQEGLFKLFPQGEFSCCLAAGWRVINANHRHAASWGGALQTTLWGLWKEGETRKSISWIIQIGSEQYNSCPIAIGVSVVLKTIKCAAIINTVYICLSVPLVRVKIKTFFILVIHAFQFAFLTFLPWTCLGTLHKLASIAKSRRFAW